MDTNEDQEPVDDKEPELMTYQDFLLELTDEAKEYHKEKLRLAMMARYLPGLILIILLFLGFPSWINTLNPLGDRFFGRFLVIVYFLIFFSLLDLPFSIYSEKLERKYNFSTRSNSKFIKDTLFGFILVAVLVGFGIAGIFEWIDTLGSWWWVPSFIATFIFSAILMAIAPILIIPIFTRMESLEEGTLRTRMEELATRMDVKYKDIYLWKLSDQTTKPNAAVMGFGSTLRIVLGDTMTQHFREDEMETVMCHEIGHYNHKDIYKGLVFISLFFLFSYILLELIFDEAIDFFEAPSRSSAETIPFFLIFIGVVQELMSVFFNWFSRKMEKAADILAIETLKNIDVYESAFARLAKRALDYPDPSFLEVLFWYDHPPIRDRVKYARNYLKTMYST